MWAVYSIYLIEKFTVTLVVYASVRNHDDDDHDYEMMMFIMVVMMLNGEARGCGQCAITIYELGIQPRFYCNPCAK